MASRWPQRLDRAASISFSISRSVRYSRGRPGRTVTFADVRRLPDGTLLKSELVRTAEQMAARLRADLDGRLAGVTWRVTKLVLGDLVRATHPPAPDRPGAVHPRPRPLPKSKS